ncbi:hypothetical protein Tco_0773598 [Tanacetum coccineum]|uniref:Tf2-1-like SH3-like domain-containing protein n=1 Tax=Tanacetum coccineum TaxID=301880 RepID=A0ABQ4ZM84_9ASTR
MRRSYVFPSKRDATSQWKRSPKRRLRKKKSKRLEDVPIVRDVPEVFPKDLLGLSLTLQVELQIDLVHDVALVARSSYKLALSKRQEMSNQLQELADKGLIRPNSSAWGALIFHGFIHEATKDNKQLRHDLGDRDHQKDYVNARHKPLEFQVGDKVMLKVLPWKGVMHFGKRGKLNPRYIGPFKILAKMYLSDETQVITLDEIQIDDTFFFIEEPIEIMDREVKRLKQSRIPIIKVRRNSRRGPEFTWKREDEFQKKYTYPFA